jgi:hypothetical protein
VLIPIVVFFCGRTYVGIRLDYIETTYVWNNLHKYIDSFDLRDSRQLNNIKDYITKFDDKLAPVEIFQKFKSPILCVNHVEYTGKGRVAYGCITNPMLSNIGFQRKIDPYTAFQEIQMFVSGVLGGSDRKPAWPISNELKAQSKGFDKFSFRRQEHPRKSKRK